MDPLENSRRLKKAVCFAAQAHETQLRKGSATPYILHPMEVCCILNAMGADNDLLMAGLLHDTLEDTSATAYQLEKEFGPEVCQLVCRHTEDKSKSWTERKERTIRELSDADERLQMLVLADKLANLRSMVRDFETLGAQLWDRFNAPKERQAWYYTSILQTLAPLRRCPHAQEYWEEMAQLVARLFGTPSARS